MSVASFFLARFQGSAKKRCSLVKYQFFQYKDEGDVVLALSMGIIYGGFVQYFITRHERNINPDETAETNGVILRRTREIKDAIFNCG